MLYVANFGPHVEDFCYWFDGLPPLECLIPVRGQVALNVTTAQASQIIAQHAPYGMLSALSIPAGQPYSGLAYAVDTPVSIAGIPTVVNQVAFPVVPTVYY